MGTIINALLDELVKLLPSQGRESGSNPLQGIIC